jgi:3-oxoacyl-[acyl-carrier protein] reductase
MTAAERPTMNLELTGKTALVLGAGSGLGRAIALALAREGARVAVAGRTPAKLDETVAAIQATGGTALALPWDLGDLDVIDSRVGTVEQALGPVDILVNNTGGPPPTPAAGQSPALWLQQFQSLVLSVIGITDRVLPGMRERGHGRIITSTSSGVVTPIPGLAISNTLRSSLMAWSKTLSREVARHGITVNVVVPGRVATDRVAQLDGLRAQREGRSVEDVAAESAAGIPMRRYGRPEEFGDVVAFLASARASYVTGSTLRVDGGLIPSI